MMLASLAMRPWLIIGGVAILVIALVFIFKSPEQDAEAQVRQTLREAVAAVEKRDLGALMDRVSHRFKGQGGMDRNGVKGILFVYVRRGDWRRVFLVDTTIEIDDNQRGARVRTGAVLASGDNLNSVTDVAPTNAATYDFDIRLECEDDDEWRVVSAKYERADFSGLLERLQR